VISACLIFSIIGTTILSPSGARAINDPPSSPYEAPNKANIPSMIFDLPTTTTTKNPSMVKDVPTTKNFSSTATCQQLSIQGVTKSAGGKSPTYAIDNSYDTYWSNNRLGSWIELDFGSSKILCSINIAWFKGNLRIYNFDVLVSNDGATFTKKLSSKSSSGTTNSLETYNLPTDTMGRYVKIVVNGNNRNSQAGIVEMVASGANPPPPPPPPPPPALANYDDFENYGTYTLGDGQTSPNGKWKVAYTGFGSVGVQQAATTGNHYFFEQPKTAISQSETHASLVSTAQQYSNFEMDLDMKTVAQLRQNSPPNTWETAWVFWHYTDEFHYYALALKTNGLQIEKKDNDNHDDSAEIYLLDTPSPNVKLGQWQHLKIIHEGSSTPHIQVWVDGAKVADFVDDQPASSAKLSSGYMGLYNEDAKVNFDNVNIKVLNSP
jgi:3-keto-disaccharide hydrolase/F5/8 type C domain